jgi:hypothetical protein
MRDSLQHLSVSHGDRGGDGDAANENAQGRRQQPPGVASTPPKRGEGHLRIPLFNVAADFFRAYRIDRFDAVKNISFWFPTYCGIGLR